MEGRNALIAAIVSGLLAVAIVTVDIQFGLEAELQIQQDGDWVGGDDEVRLREPYIGSGCSDGDLRLWVHNGRLTKTTVDVQVTYYTNAGQTVVELDDTWTLARGETRTHEFSVPASAYEPAENNAESPQTVQRTVSVNGVVDDIHLYACATEATQ